jgi:mRNA interferase MazF
MKQKWIHEREVWLVDLEPTIGIELRKIRPAVVLRKFSYEHFVILPITSSSKNGFSFDCIFMKKESFVKINQIRTVDVSRFKRKYGELSERQFRQIKLKTAEILRLPPRGANAQNCLYSITEK